MSETQEHIYTCDNCGKKEDVGFSVSNPRDWSRVEIKTTSGICLYASVDLCDKCGYNNGQWHSISSEKTKKSLLISLMKKFCGLNQSSSNELKEEK